MGYALCTSLMESIFATLLFIDIIRIQLVCKEWRSIIRSPTFKNALYEVENRRPWFLMVDSEYNLNSTYDMEVGNWQQWRFEIPTDSSNKQLIPIVSSGEYVCYISDIGSLTVVNPFSGSRYAIEDFQADMYVKAISMLCCRNSFKIFVVFKNSSNLKVAIYSSLELKWKTLQLQVQQVVNGNELKCETVTGCLWRQWNTKIGLTAIDNDGHIIVYYINERSQVVKCDMKHQIAYKYSLVGIQHDENYGFEMVECGGRILILVLKCHDINDTSDDEYSLDSDDEAPIQEWNDEKLHDNILMKDANMRYYEFKDANRMNEDLLEDIGIRNNEASSDGYQIGPTIEIYEFDNDILEWVSIAVSPPDMLEEFSEIEAEIYCSGHRDMMMICVSSEEWSIYDVIKYNIAERAWDKLPPCNDPDTGVAKKFVSAYSIMPKLF